MLQRWLNRVNEGRLGTCSVMATTDDGEETGKPTFCKIYKNRLQRRKNYFNLFLTEFTSFNEHLLLLLLSKYPESKN